MLPPTPHHHHHPTKVVTYYSERHTKGADCCFGCRVTTTKKVALDQNGAEPCGQSKEEEREERGRRRRGRLITCSLLRLKADGFGGRQAARRSESGGQAHIALEDRGASEGELQTHTASL